MPAYKAAAAAAAAAEVAYAELAACCGTCSSRQPSQPGARATEEAHGTLHPVALMALLMTQHHLVGICFATLCCILVRFINNRQSHFLITSGLLRAGSLIGDIL